MALFARHAKEVKIPYLYSRKGFYPDVPAERINTIRGFLDGHYAGYGFPGGQQVVTLCDQYVYGGDMTLDEVVIEGQRIIDMMRKEQYIGP